MAQFDEIELLVHSGEFARALTVLQDNTGPLKAVDPLRHAVLIAELLHQTGDANGAGILAGSSLPSASSFPEYTARLHYVLGRSSYERGQFETAFDHMSRSLAAARSAQSPTYLPKAQLALLTLFADAGRPLPLLPEIRRSVAKSGEPHLMVALRLCFAKAETARQSPQEARRHLISAAALLESFPNVALQGRLHLGLSVVDSLCGDPASAADQARRAIQCAATSGHVRTRFAGLLNLSHALQAVQRLDEARRCADDVLARVGKDVEMRIAALDAVANVLISEGNLEEAESELSQVDELVRDAIGEYWSNWARLTVVETRVRLFHSREMWTEASELISKSIGEDQPRRHLTWKARLDLQRFKGLVMARRDASAAKVLMSLDQNPQTLDGFCQRMAVLAVHDLISGRMTRGQRRMARAIRVSEVQGATAAALEFTRWSDKAKGLAGSEADQPEAYSPPDLDSAAALLELGGHPHVLAREAVAVIDGSACARAMALVAAGPAGSRVIEAHGWTDREAAAAAANAAAFETIPLGVYRDEPWHLLVDPKPDLADRCTFIAIRKLIATAVALDRYRRDEKQRAALWPAESLDGDPDSIWASEQMSEILTIARRIAPTPLSILLTGETGTGKEMLAHTIHRASDRAARTFLPFNCSAVPRDMLESQLFGYRKGAFTGADAAFPGVIRSAVGGTLFLDEIADVSLEVQPKLLRFLETHEIHPLGEPQPIKVDVRVIAATNASLDQLVTAGRFREDLFYRLNVVQLKLPPLRERREEIPALIDHYLRRYGDEQKKGRLTLADDTLEYLLLFSWPGNVRQLANEVRRMVAMAEPNGTLTPASLSPEIQASRRTVPVTADAEPEVRVRIDQPLPLAVQMLEQMMVRNALDRSHGRVEEAARLLGISRKGLFLKRRRWGFSHASHTAQ